MFAIDIPTAVFVGFVFADCGQKIIESSKTENKKFQSLQKDKNQVDLIQNGKEQLEWGFSKLNQLRLVVALFNVFFFTPVPLIFLNGWPGWQMNYVASWADDLLDKPLRAAVTVFFFVITVLPALLSFEIGKMLVYKEKGKYIKWCSWFMAGVVAFIIFLTRDATFHIATTYKDYHAGHTYPFTHPPFITLLAITTIYSWGALIIIYNRIKRKK